MMSFLSFAGARGRSGNTVDLFFRPTNEAAALSLRPRELWYAEYWKSCSVLSAALRAAYLRAAGAGAVIDF